MRCTQLFFFHFVVIFLSLCGYHFVVSFFLSLCGYSILSGDFAAILWLFYLYFVVILICFHMFLCFHWFSAGEMFPITLLKVRDFSSFAWLPIASHTIENSELLRSKEGG